MLADILHRLSLHNLILPIFVLSLLACSEQDRVATSATDASAWQAVQIDGVPYYKGAAKANATAQQSDLSIEFLYRLEDGQARIYGVRIDGVTFLRDGLLPPSGLCNPPVATDPLEFSTEGGDEADLEILNDPLSWEGGDASNILANLVPSPNQIRLKVEGNEKYLRQRFETAFNLGRFVPQSTDSYRHTGSRTTYNLTDGKDDFFRMEFPQTARYIIKSSGGTDTWGDLYKDEGDSIKPIAGTGTWGDHDNFAFEMILGPGVYYLRVSPEKNEPAGAYEVNVEPFLLDEDDG